MRDRVTRPAVLVRSWDPSCAEFSPGLQIILFSRQA